MEEKAASLKDAIERHRKDHAELKKLRIQKLHDYNEIKDFCQFLLGRLAHIQQSTVAELYPRFGLERDD